MSFLDQNFKLLRSLDIPGETLTCGDRINGVCGVDVSSDRPTERPAGQHADCDDADLIRSGCIDELSVILVGKAVRGRHASAGIKQVEAALNARCRNARHRLMQRFGFAQSVDPPAPIR